MAEVFPILFTGEGNAFIMNKLIMERVTEATGDGVLLGQVITLGRLEIDTILVANSTERAQQIYDMVTISSWAREVTEAPARRAPAVFARRDCFRCKRVVLFARFCFDLKLSLTTLFCLSYSRLSPNQFFPD